jgi:hypothetical protein
MSIKASLLTVKDVGPQGLRQGVDIAEGIQVWAFRHLVSKTVELTDRRCGDGGPEARCSAEEVEMAPVATDFCSRLKRGYEVLDDQRRCKQNGERLEVGGIEGVGTGHHRGMWTVQELRSKLQ